MVVARPSGQEEVSAEFRRAAPRGELAYWSWCSRPTPVSGEGHGCEGLQSRDGPWLLTSNTAWMARRIPSRA